MHLLSKLFDNIPDPGLEEKVVFWGSNSPPAMAIEDVLSLTDSSFNSSTSQQDTYFHVATHNASEIPYGKRGSIATSQHVCFLWADVDVFEWKGSKASTDYPTIATVKTLLSKLREMGVGATHLVHSGGGFHVYWKLTVAMPTSNYPSLGKKWIGFLNEQVAAIQSGAKIDATGDYARVLRVPGTRNSNTGTIVTVKGMSDVTHPIENLIKACGYDPMTPVKSIRKVIKDPKPGSDAMRGMVAPHLPFEKPSLEEMKLCGQVVNFVAKGGDVEEPMWKAMSGVFYYLSDGEKYFVNISKHAHGIRDTPRDENSALAKLKAWGQNTGPVTCQHLESLDAETCKKCPLYKRLTTPLQLPNYHMVKKNKVAQSQIVDGPTYHDGLANYREDIHELERSVSSKNVVVNFYDRKKEDFHALPAGYKLDNRNQIVREAHGEVGGQEIRDNIVVCQSGLYPISLYRDPIDASESYVEFLHVVNDYEQRQLKIPSHLMGSAQLLSFFYANHLPTPPNDPSGMELKKYISACIILLRDIQGEHHMISRTGWIIDEEYDVLQGFNAGEYCFLTGGKAVKSKPSPIHEDLEIKGTVDDWKRGISFFHYPEFEYHRLMFVSGFAAPLMALSQFEGMMINIHSRHSGTFKSFTLASIASIYGKPKNDYILPNDTEKSSFKKAMSRSDLPVIYDELSRSSKEQVSRILYTMTQGREGSRLTKDAKQNKDLEQGRTMMFSSSNDNLKEMLIGKMVAESGRLIQFTANSQVKKSKSMTLTNTSEYMELLKANHGVAGAIWISYILENQDELRDNIQSAMDMFQKRYEAYDLNRFMIAYAALTTVSAMRAYNLGLIDFKPEIIIDTLDKLVKAEYKFQIDNEASPERLISDLLNEQRRNMAIVSYQGRKVGTTCTVIRVPEDDAINILVEKVVTPHGENIETHIRKAVFDKYIREHDLSISDTTDYLIRHGIMLRERPYQKHMPKSIGVDMRMMSYGINLSALNSAGEFKSEVEEVSDEVIADEVKKNKIVKMRERRKQHVEIMNNSKVDTSSKSKDN